MDILLENHQRFVERTFNSIVVGEKKKRKEKKKADNKEKRLCILCCVCFLSLFMNFQNESAHQPTLQDIPKSLHPYDRTSEALFSVSILSIF